MSKPGLQLCANFFGKVVQTIVERHANGAAFAAARIGRGSEVLGYDTPMSFDHDYGPSVQLFLRERDFAVLAPRLMQSLDEEIPESFEGWPTRFPASFRPNATGLAARAIGGAHGVDIYTVDGWCDRFFQRRFTDDLTPFEWLSYPEQIFLTATAGRVFRDDFEELTMLRRRLAYLPKDIWLFKLAAQWWKIGEERAYTGRAGSVGDELGSRVAATRAVENLMRLAFLIERKYVPYPKWFGRAFEELDCAANLSGIAADVLNADGWKDREKQIARATRLMAELQVARVVPGAIEPATGKLHDRPLHFIDSPSIADALLSEITDGTVRSMHPLGGPDQYLSSNYLLGVPELTRTAAETLLRAPIFPPRDRPD